MAKTPAALLDPATFEGPADDGPGTPDGQVTIRGRNVEVPDHFKNRINAKLAKIEKMSPTITRFDVILLHENNPRLAKVSQRIEITLRGKAGIARAEAAEDTFYGALESAIAKLERQMRKVRTRRKISQSGHRRPQSVGEATAQLVAEAAPAAEEVDQYADGVDDQLPGQIVRRKEHDGTPMTVDDALERMELVGHDFYLFRDSDTGRATVVYRRHAFDYGLLTLSDGA